MALFLSESDVRAVLTMPLALAAVESAHRALACEGAQDTPRQRTKLPKTMLHILQGALPGENVIGYKAYTSNRSGARFLVHLFAADTGVPEAVVEANFLGMMRTGAASGLASRLLARPGARTAGIFGAGWQARGHLEALCTALPGLERIFVLARDREWLTAFCREQEERLQREIVPAASAQEAVAERDIVGTVTTASSPLFDAEWLTPGTHINAAGSNSLLRRELSPQCVARCELIVVDSVDTALKEAGDLLPALETGRLCSRQLVELGDILTGRHPGRTGPESISLFESQGLAVQDLALAQKVVALARERKLGTEYPLCV
ncbi:MAG: ornithine cyclodeaminase family protein [Betaproteobacteria bacterium]|nr:ornithine cyclodeaminase family protein [Betaproteobacteria bacterium]